jgi:hypothetical protein
MSRVHGGIRLYFFMLSDRSYDTEMEDFLVSQDRCAPVRTAIFKSKNNKCCGGWVKQELFYTVGGNTN